MPYFATRIETPLGLFVAAVDDSGRVSWSGFSDEPDAPLLQRWAERNDKAVTWRDAPAAEVRRQIDDYFEGNRTDFDLPLAPRGTKFQVRYWRALARVKFGTTVTYAEMARQLGSPKSARAVGRANAANPLALLLPCHRVIGSRGGLTGYAAGILRKRALLDFESGVGRVAFANALQAKHGQPGSSDETLDEIANRLEAAGLADQAASLRRTQEYVEAIDRPPGIFTRVTNRVSEVAKEQWGHVVAELRESREAWELIQKRVARGEKLSAEEADTVRAQLMDAFRVVPASVLTAATLVAPVPGVALLSPWVLRRLGLLPSRWREAHVLDQLRKQHADLKAIGQVDHADRLEEVMHEIEVDAENRERVERDLELLRYWDIDSDGQWDDAERQAYRAEVQRLADEVTRIGVRREWFVLVENQVFGPARWSELPEELPELTVLVSLNGQTKWVDLRDLRLARAAKGLDAPPEAAVPAEDTEPAAAAD